MMANGFDLVTGGRNHLILWTSQENISGKEAEDALGKAGITVTKYGAQ